MTRWGVVLPLTAALILSVHAAPSPGETHRPAGTENVQVNLVLIDLVARARRDRPVSGLRLDDLELLIDNEDVDPADIESFEEICGADTAHEAPARAPASIRAESIAPAGSAAPRNIVLYFDFQQLTVAGRGLSIEAAREFVLSRLAPPDRIMIVAFRRDLRLLQGFTADRALLLEALAGLRDDNSSVAEDPIEMWQDLAEVSGKQCTLDRDCPQRISAARAFAGAEKARARRSLQSMLDLLPMLSGMKGRKALVLFTDVLRAEPGAQFFRLGYVWPALPEFDLTDDLLRLTREANASGVSFYTVHASGLDDNTHEPFREARGTGFTLGEKPGPFKPQPDIIEVDRVDNAPSYDAIRAGRDSALALQSTLAVETGGRALQRTNDLGAVLDAARQDLACYYLIGYRHVGPADGGRHSIEIQLKPGARRQLGDVTLRYRPYFHDISASGRLEQAFSSALRAPELFRGLPVTVEAFVLAPRPAGHGVLVKTSVPLSSFFLAAVSSSTLEGSAAVRGEVRREEDLVCAFENHVPLRIQVGHTKSLILETGCLLDEGTYELSVAVVDLATREIGARRSSMVVPPAPHSDRAYMSEVSLWRRDPESILIASGASAIGIGDVSGREAFIPQAERRMNSSQEAKLNFVLCPRPGAAPEAGFPIRVHRELKGEADRSIAGFHDLLIEDPPDAATGCYQISSAIPAGTLGEGLYRFIIEAFGQSLGATIRREVDLAVEAR